MAGDKYLQPNKGCSIHIHPILEHAIDDNPEIVRQASRRYEMSRDNRARIEGENLPPNAADREGIQADIVPPDREAHIESKLASDALSLELSSCKAAWEQVYQDKEANINDITKVPIISGGSISASTLQHSSKFSVENDNAANLQSEFANGPTEYPSTSITGPLIGINVKASTPLCFWSLPPEIRQIIYRKILCSARMLLAGALVKERRSCLMISRFQRKYQEVDIDSAILCTCRKIYYEALPVLYQNNEYAFENVQQLRTFRAEGLDYVPGSLDAALSEGRDYRAKNSEGSRCRDSSMPLFGLSPNPQGRLTYVRRMVLRFDSNATKLTMYRQPLSVRLAQAPMPSPKENKARSHAEWTEFFQGSRCADSGDYISFPALEHLVLDFSPWNLHKHDEVAVSLLLSPRAASISFLIESIQAGPFVTRLGARKPIKSLRVVGLQHQRSLQALKVGLVGDCGDFGWSRTWSIKK